MCRLLGASASRPVDLEYFLVTGPRPFKDLGGLEAPGWAPFPDKNSHPDGWGLGWYEAGMPRCRKRPEPAAQSVELRRQTAQARSKAFVCHIRKASQGEKTEQNCHPFRHGNWLFAHNGTVTRAPLYEKLNDQHRAALEGTTDSEVFFHCILQNIEKGEDKVEPGIRRSLEEVEKYEFSAMNFLLADGTSLYAFRQASRDQDYYSLRYLPVASWPASAGPAEDLRAVLVCSEKLTDGDWEEIPLGHLLVVSPGLDCRLVPVLGPGR